MEPNGRRGRHNEDPYSRYPCVVGENAVLSYIKTMDKGLIVHTVIYNAEHKVLIIKRAKVNNVLPEFWDIPGGTLKDGEDPAAGAMREVKEETGLNITDLRLFSEYSNVDAVKNKQFVTLIFAAKYSGGEVVLNPEEHEEYAWIAPEDIGRYKAVAYLPLCLTAFSQYFPE